jgi:hypothetical protein
MSPDIEGGNRSEQIETMAKLFPDGTAIDQVRGNLLILWRQGRRHVGSTAPYGDKTYIPVTLDANLEEVLHLPTGSEDLGLAEDGIAELQEAFAALGLDEKFSFLAAIATKATWVAECLPNPLLINLWGAVGTETALLEFMSSVCRRALRLAEPSVHELARLPAGFGPTLLLSRPSERALARLVAATGGPDTYFLSGGEIAHLRCPMVVCTGKPVTLPALTIPLLPAARPLRRITRLERQTVADRFQPLFLGYRLTKHVDVANSQFDAPEFCPEVRLLARILGAVLEGSPNLQARMMDALRSLDEQRKEEQSQAPVAVVLEALLTLSHTRAPGVYVGSLTELAKSLLENRDENIQLSPRRVGEMLRQELGLSGKRHGPGYEIALDRNTQQRVHLLASTYNVWQPAVDCPLCQETLVSTRPDAVSGP